MPTRSGASSERAALRPISPSIGWT
jgi:hypothetical protein